MHGYIETYLNYHVKIVFSLVFGASRAYRYARQRVEFLLDFPAGLRASEFFWPRRTRYQSRGTTAHSVGRRPRVFGLVTGKLSKVLRVGSRAARTKRYPSNLRNKLRDKCKIAFRFFLLFTPPPPQFPVHRNKLIVLPIRVVFFVFFSSRKIVYFGMIGKEMWKFSTRRYFPSPLVYPQINPRCRADCFILTCAFLFCLRTIPVNPSLIVIHFWGRDAFSARLSSRVSELQRSFRIILYFYFFFPPDWFSQ